MATTKELLETAIRKVASNAIGRDSSNQGTVTIAVNSTSTDWQSYTPSADGFIFLHMEGGGNPAVLHMKDYTNNPAIENLTAYPEARNIKTMRVWKGKTALFKAATTHTSLTALFFKSIGGGLKALAETLWRSGGELWLRLRVYLMRLSKQGASSLTRRAIQLQSRLYRLTQPNLHRGQINTLTLAQPMEYCWFTTPSERTRISAERRLVVESKKLEHTQKTHATRGCLRARETLLLLQPSIQRLRQQSLSILRVGKSSLALEGGI